MWVFTTDGAYSAVALPSGHPDARATRPRGGRCYGLLSVRSRVAADRDTLAGWLSDKGWDAWSLDAEGLERDYPYRVLTWPEAWADYVEDAAVRVDYPNYKTAVLHRQGLYRASVYAQVWKACLALQYESESTKPTWPT